MLRRILIQIETMKGLTKADIAAMGDEAGEALAASVRRVYMANAMKYAIIFIASLPMLLIYPFIQKYFVKGVMIGSVKG